MADIIIRVAILSLLSVPQCLSRNIAFNEFTSKFKLSQAQDPNCLQIASWVRFFTVSEVIS